MPVFFARKLKTLTAEQGRVRYSLHPAQATTYGLGINASLAVGTLTAARSDVKQELKRRRARLARLMHIRGRVATAVRSTRCTRSSTSRVRQHGARPGRVSQDLRSERSGRDGAH